MPVVALSRIDESDEQVLQLRKIWLLRASVRRRVVRESSLEQIVEIDTLWSAMAMVTQKFEVVVVMVVPVGIFTVIHVAYVVVEEFGYGCFRVLPRDSILITRLALHLREHLCILYNILEGGIVIYPAHSMDMWVSALTNFEPQPILEGGVFIGRDKMGHGVTYENFDTNGLHEHNDVGIVHTLLAALCVSFLGVRIKRMVGVFDILR